MEDVETIKVLNRIEDAICCKDCSDSYRSFLITCLLLHRDNLNDAINIRNEDCLGFSYTETNLCIAMKFGLPVYDVAIFNDDKNLRYVFNSKDDEPLSLLNSEIKKVFLSSKQLLSEIGQKLEEIKIVPAEDSIIKLFDEETAEEVRGLVDKSFDCFKFKNSCLLRFLRSDGSEFEFEAELAEDDMELDTGLSGRPYLPEYAAMFYTSDAEIFNRFVTTNVCAELSVAYMNREGIITEIVDRKENDHVPYINECPAQYVLEVRKGWFRKNNLKEGDRVLMKSLIVNR